MSEIVCVVVGGYRRRMTSPTGKRPRNLFFYGAVLFFLGIMYFLYVGNLVLAVGSGLLAVACVFAASRPRGGT